MSPYTLFLQSSVRDHIKATQEGKMFEYQQKWNKKGGIALYYSWKVLSSEIVTPITGSIQYWMQTLVPGKSLMTSWPIIEYQ